MERIICARPLQIRGLLMESRLRYKQHCITIIIRKELEIDTGGKLYAIPIKLYERTHQTHKSAKSKQTQTHVEDRHIQKWVVKQIRSKLIIMIKTDKYTYQIHKKANASTNKHKINKQMHKTIHKRPFMREDALYVYVSLLYPEHCCVTSIQFLL